MKVYFASDHGGFEMKKMLVPFVQDLGYEVEDCGAHMFDVRDDYPDIIAGAARKLSVDVLAGKDSKAIILGGSGQGEAIVANRFKGVRAVVYYGDIGTQTDSSGHTIGIIESTRMHNDANALSIGGRFLSEGQIKEAVKMWLATSFPGEERHARRIAQIDQVT